MVELCKDHTRAQGLLPEAFSALVGRDPGSDCEISPTGPVKNAHKDEPPDHQILPGTACEGSSFAPSHLRRVIIGHQLVNAD